MTPIDKLLNTLVSSSNTAVQANICREIQNQMKILMKGEFQRGYNTGWNDGNSEANKPKPFNFR